MLTRIRHRFLGAPLPTHQLVHARLNKVRALAAFSPDALSSIAYANQEIYLGLIVAGSAGLSMSTPIGLAIVGLLALVALSYFQTVQAYTSGGGSYAVARENLGTLPGLITAAALLIGYLLTAAVSLTAGVEAIASAFPILWPYRVVLSLALLLAIMLINLRGTQETGTLMSIPVYLFLLVYLSMLAYGVVRLRIEGPDPLVGSAPTALQPLTMLLLLLRAFASGCTALTGIEAISNGVPAFRSPEARNAGQTLLVMALLMGVLFVGSVGLTQAFGVIAGPEETILSALARRLLGNGPAYLAIQASTMLILTVAANTSFAGFPRLAAILAGDGFLPRQLTNLGDRLVFANGILLLAAATGVLIVAFGGDTHSLIPLFAVGVFLAFTFSQVGMVIHWFRKRGRGWRVKALINGVGMVATAVTVVVVGASKFIEGAWITFLLIPTLVFAFLKIRAHYRQVSEELSLGEETGLSPVLVSPRVVVPISAVHRGILDAIDYARSISSEVTVIYVEVEPGAGESIREEWNRHQLAVPLVVVPSPYRSVVGPLLDYLDETDGQHDDGQLATVVLPELVSARWWHNLLHNQTAWLIKAALLYRRRHLGFQRVIVDVPYHLQR
jgi:amino acid transporter